MCKLATIQREIFSEIGRNLDWNVSSFEATLRRCNVICDLRCNVMFCIKSEKTSTEVMIQLKMTLTSTNDANHCMSVEKPAEKVGISIRSCHDISPFDDWTAGGKSNPCNSLKKPVMTKNSCKKTLYRCSRKSRIAVIVMNTERFCIQINNNKTGTKWDVNIWKVFGSWWGYGERSSTNLTLPRQLRCRVI